jgi:hypothetical protein
MLPLKIVSSESAMEFQFFSLVDVNARQPDSCLFFQTRLIGQGWAQ